MLSIAGPARAQGLLGITGANHPELTWSEIETDHFILTYHNGLDSIARIAAPIAEEVYRVVTTNLQTPLNKKLRIYFSNNDEVKNAFAFSDDYIFVWMRGILDDEPLTLRASGTSKWLRSVITHEFTHIVIARATADWTRIFFPLPGVPRWFNEGMARYMEPDGWTPDLDMLLRIAAVSSELNFNLDEFMGGTLMYEGGQSLVRYIAATYGDSALAKIIKYRKGVMYNFEAGVQAATKKSMSEIYNDWHKVLNVYYNTQFGQKEDIVDIGRKIPTGLQIVVAARLAPDHSRIALLGKRSEDEGAKLYILSNDSNGDVELVTGEPGITPYLSWSPDGRSLLFSKIRFGDNSDLVYDLYKCDASSGSLTRLTSDAHLEYPDWSPDGKQIVAVQTWLSGSDLVVLNADGSNLRKITNYNDQNTSVYSPRWSPDGSSVAFSIFAANGMRDVMLATGLANGSATLQTITHDSINDRYPVWSPDGKQLVYLSYRGGLPNVFVAGGPTAPTRELTDVAGNVMPWDWYKDSVLVTSSEFKRSLQLYWVSANRNVSQAPPVPLAAKYTKWRDVHWPLVTRTQDSLPPVITAGPYAYNSLAHIRMLVLLPLIGSDLSRTHESGTQWGLGTVLRDDMGKHTLGLGATYGDVSHFLSYYVDYQNSQLRPNILLGAHDIMGFHDVLYERSYYQRDRGYRIGMNYIVPTPDALTKIHMFYLGADYDKIEPWNAADYSYLPDGLRPLNVTLLRFAGKYAYLGPEFQAGIGAMHTDKKIGSDLTMTRLRAFMHYELPLTEDQHTQLALVTRAGAQEGDELPQDFLGIHKYDVFQGGFNLSSLASSDRLRGIRRSIYGNTLATAALEFRQRDVFFSNLVPLLQAFQPQLVEFAEIGSAWYASVPTNNPYVKVTPLARTTWLKTAGIELRSELAFDLSLSGGVAWELVENAHPDWYFRLAADF